MCVLNLFFRAIIVAFLMKKEKLEELFMDKLSILREDIQLSIIMNRNWLELFWPESSFYCYDQIKD